ncbi:MAG TPA: 7-cyano-7-deazaguanine synthase [Bryobacteraceae bacterium]|nr:7-cyano-7-deazaguanine synthase [Bryobacteraceae bacterium]
MKTAAAPAISPAVSHLAIHVAERGVRTPASVLRCGIEDNVEFSTTSLQSYFFSRWDPIAWDALLVAAAVEFADKTQHRPIRLWRRSFDLRVPVHDPRLWNSSKVCATLRDALQFLTGDDWQFEFVARKRAVERPEQIPLSLDPDTEAVIPFSNGLDSCAVGGLLEKQLGSRLVRIRLGPGQQDGKALAKKQKAFTRIPYDVSSGEKPFVESSARSRGFKFATISAIAAYLANASRIIVPESGQGALGPSLVTVGQAGEDYRSHPLFTRKMEAFVNALFGHAVVYEFPRIWHTKAETLREFIDKCKDTAWMTTKSCWQQNRQTAVGGKWRHCGICAACMLRRMSIHGAGQTEPKETYVWEDLSARSFETGAAKDFDKNKITKAMHEYAIAGALHLDHLAALLGSPANAPTLELNAWHLSESLGLPERDVRKKQDRLLQQHSLEWKNFMNSLGKKSFIFDWLPGARP